MQIRTWAPLAGTVGQRSDWRSNVTASPGSIPRRRSQLRAPRAAPPPSAAVRPVVHSIMTLLRDRCPLRADVHSFVVGNHPANVEVPLDAPPPRLAHPARQLRIAR